MMMNKTQHKSVLKPRGYLCNRCNFTMFTCVRFTVTLTAEQSELITNPIQFDEDMKRTYDKARILRAQSLFGEVFGSSFKYGGNRLISRFDGIQGQAFSDGLAMHGQKYGDAGAAHFAIASDAATGGWTAYHVKTLGGRFTAHSEFYMASSLTQSWGEALQIIETKADWGIRGVPSDEDEQNVDHDDGAGYNPGGCDRCGNGCKYCCKGDWSDDDESCDGCFTGCPRCMSDYPESSDNDQELPEDSDDNQELPVDGMSRVRLDNDSDA
jgi:hypothetical protein